MNDDAAEMKEESRTVILNPQVEIYIGRSLCS